MTVKRKKRVVITGDLMDLLLKYGPTGVVANASFARENNWSPSGVYHVINDLLEKKILVGTPTGKNRRVAVSSDIKSHTDWLLTYFNSVEDVPPRYRRFLEVEKVKKDVPVIHLAHPTSETITPSVKDRIKNMGLELVRAVDEVLAENEELKQRIFELEKKLLEIEALAKAGIN